MAIEGSIKENVGLMNISDFGSEGNPFQISTLIIAGNLKVKHPLINQPLLILGFIINDYSLNQDDFKIKGMEIEYKIGGNYSSFNRIIYPKMIIDRQINHVSDLFTDDSIIKIRYRSYLTQIKKIDGEYKLDNRNYKSSYDGHLKFDHYLFSMNHSIIPECVTDELVFALCKFREDGIFKHAILNFQELLPVENQ